MRVVVVGTVGERRELRSALEGSSPIVIGEFESIAAARRSGIPADAIVMGTRDEPDTEDPSAVETLTPREIEVLELVAEGLSNKVIATRLGISDQTVKFHVGSISGKLGAANRTDAVRRAVRRGLIFL
jgi:DNA-binding NarL/FixJ family response regulator